MKYKYSTSIASNLEIIESCIDEILQELNTLVGNNDVMFDLKLILNELVINSATHGNDLKESKLIKLDISLKDNKFEIFVEDEGQGIDYDFNSYDPLKLECCGRGLVIVNSLSDELLIEKNKIKVVKKIK